MLKPAHFSTADEILATIKSAQSVLLHLHRNPDGDSIGSNMAMAEWLRSLGKKVILANFSALPTNLVHYCDISIIQNGYPAEFANQNIDLHLSLDSADWNIFSDRSGALPEQFKKLNRINIDHHASNTLFGNQNLVDPSYTSCAELLYDLLKYWQIKINQSIGTKLLLGIITDTGGFRWGGITSTTFRTAAEIVDIGVDLDKINFSVFKMVPLGVLKLWKILLSNMQLDKQFNCIHTYIDYLSIYDVGEDGMNHEITSNVLLSSIEGTDFGFVLKERRPGHIEVSFRGRTGKIDVSKIAVSLGGGGHPQAAGCLLRDMSISQAQTHIFHTVSSIYSLPSA